jgi:hypothetical protein
VIEGIGESIGAIAENAPVTVDLVHTETENTIGMTDGMDMIDMMDMMDMIDTTCTITTDIHMIVAIGINI